jgi:hypothetical protein
MMQDSGHGGRLPANPDDINDPANLVDALRADMMNNLNLAQTPTLLGQENRMDEIFLAPWTTSE